MLTVLAKKDSLGCPFLLICFVSKVVYNLSAFLGWDAFQYVKTNKA